MRTTIAIFLIIILFILLCDIDVSHAALSNKDILDTVLEKYKTSAASWASVIQERATWLFLSLMTISIVWTFFPLMFHRSSFPEIFGEMVRFCAFCGFFLWLLNNGPAIADAIIESLRQLGNKASGMPGVTPSSIVDIGFKLLSKTLKDFSLWEVGEYIVTVLISVAVVIILALVAINMLLQLCAAWVLAYAGILFLGFGGSKWTSDMAINYFKTVLGLGASLMTMTLLVGIGTEIIAEAQAKMSANAKIEELVILLVYSISLLLLVDKVPSMVSGIITGAGIGSMGVGSFGAGAAMGAAQTAAAGVSLAGSVAKNGVLGAAGAVAAGRAAMQAAAMQGMGSTGGQGGKSESGGRSLSDAMGVKTPFAAAKIAAKTAMQGAVGNTKGGRLAQEIQKQYGGK